MKFKFPKIPPYKVDTTIREGDKNCRHRFEVVGTNPRFLALQCKKCQARTERATTRLQRKRITAQLKRQMSKIGRIHKLFHEVRRKFVVSTNQGNKFKKKGYDFITQMERHIKSRPEIHAVKVDDSLHCGSRIFIIPHERSSEYWGTTLLYVPQCTGEEPIEIFLYPSHLDRLVEELKNIQKREKRKNRGKER